MGFHMLPFGAEFKEVATRGVMFIVLPACHVIKGAVDSLPTDPAVYMSSLPPVYRFLQVVVACGPLFSRVCTHPALCH